MIGTFQVYSMSLLAEKILCGSISLNETFEVNEISHYSRHFSTNLTVKL